MLERFQLRERQTTLRTEAMAGVTTFAAMAYILFVNPSILAQAGMPFDAVVLATCASAALGSVLMGLLANLPLALAPGMGLNAYFTYTVVLGLGVPWPTALGAVFLSGVAFLLLTLTGLRQALLRAIPHELHTAVAAGIGLFIAFVGLRNAAIIVPSPATLVALGHLRAPGPLLACAGLLLVAVLQALGVRAALLLGVVGTLALAILTGQFRPHPQPVSLGALRLTAFHLDLAGALHRGAVEILFTFLFVDLFDNLGTLLAVADRAGLEGEDSAVPALGRVFIADSLSTMAGALLGTSTVTSYVESGAGVAAGGRTGLTAISTGLLFALAIFVAPWLGPLPPFCTTPALVSVGVLMVGGVGRIAWGEPRVALPAFLTVLGIPLTYSIASGLGLGLIAWSALELATGRGRRQHWLLYLLSVLFLVRFAFAAQG